LNDKDELLFSKPFTRSNYGFWSPEILKLDCIPSSCPTNCFFYSLGLLLLYSMFGSREKESLNIIFGTKLYWCILRLLSEKRTLLYI
jgi:hypothetical protein